MLNWLSRFRAQPELVPTYRASLASAMELTDPELVDAGLARLEPSIVGMDFLLPPTHPQLQPLAIGTDYKFGPGEVDALQSLAAASCIAHSADAWAYFASATRAALAGDLSVARHLIYYSELRSAFSILARQGVMIRSSEHAVLTGVSTVAYIGPKPTHDAVWDALKAWMKTTNAKSFFLDRLKIDRVPLREWLEASGDGQLLQGPMEDILRLIGFDLSNFKKDRGRRNIASYGARQIRTHEPHHVDAWLANKLADYWSVVEPISSNGFDALDRHFCLRVLIRARKVANKSTNPDKLYEHFEALAGELNLDQPETIALTAKLHESTAGGQIASDAALVDSGGTASASEMLISMFARALLLARFATLAVEDLVEKSGVGPDLLDRWTANLGSQHGLWDPAGGPTNLFDVWSFSKESADELSAFSSATSLHSFMGAAGEHTFGATSFAALALWWRGEWVDDLPVVA